MKLSVAVNLLFLVQGMGASPAGVPSATSLTAPRTSWEHKSPSVLSFIPAWTAFTSPSENADRLTHATVYDPANDKFYMIGGTPDGTGGSNLSSNYRYDPATDVWDTLASMPTPRGWLKGTYVRGKIYVIGGYSNIGATLNTNEEFTILTNTWATKAPKPTAVLAQEELAWRDSLIFELGGFNGSAGIATVEIYNPFTDSWSTGTSLPQPFGMGGAAIIGDNIYILGGFSDFSNETCWTNVVQGGIDPANPTQITWTTKASLPVPNCVDAAATLNGKVYMLGGFENGETVTDSLWQYDPATNAFTTLDPYNVTIARNHYLIGRPSENALYVFAGDANGDFVPPNYYYYKYPLSVGVEEGKAISGKQATEVALAQNLPNPVISQTRIEFVLPRAGVATLKLYNVAGQEVKTLTNGTLSAGAHMASLSAGKLPTGVYFYRLGFEGKTLTRTMIVVR